MAQGKRAGTRRKRQFRPALLVLAVGVTLSLVGWGYLVKAAIDFGTDARQGDGGSWGYCALAAAGATACFFLALILLARISRALGITQGPEPRSSRTPRTHDHR